MELTSAVLDPGNTTDTYADARTFLENAFGYYLVIASRFLYTGLIVILSFHHQKRMTRIGEQFQYILLDETTHLNFGTDVINGIKAETASHEHWRSSNVQLIGCEETSSWNWLRGRDLFGDYVRPIADWRLPSACQRSSAPPIRPLDERATDFGKDENFFVARATEYESAGVLSWD